MPDEPIRQTTPTDLGGWTASGKLSLYYIHPGLAHALSQGRLPGRLSKGWRRHVRRQKASHHGKR